ncbi:adhesion G protein-coupled receptor E5-like isoform X2 [Biomphalaria glabrata]|uniref:Adhesion G protein-coupled receptor E5-like isoform X2 n=1 Tax=Biomphalaria glabrata TaxID=6526 RepID=A0A9W3AI81_BIOGL|nr:adhesion G protein-coupled receptor E5-like isoform X2 [Biomphalaria glabrata]
MNINMLLVHLAVLVSIVDSQNFASGFHSYFNFICPANHIIDKISSVYSSGHKDRSFEIGCRSVRSTMDCTPSDYVNIFDKLLNYTCPGSQVLSGVGSEYSNDKADRRFKFFCCKVKDSEFQRCHETFFIHDFQQEMKLNVKEGQAIKHIYSHHLDQSNDRQWTFTLCEDEPRQANLNKLKSECNVTEIEQGSELTFQQKHCVSSQLENFSDKDALASHLTETVAYVADYMEYFVDNGIKVPKNITNTIVDILSAFRTKTSDSDFSVDNTTFDQLVTLADIVTFSMQDNMTDTPDEDYDTINSIVTSLESVVFTLRSNQTNDFVSVKKSIGVKIGTISQDVQFPTSNRSVSNLFDNWIRETKNTIVLSKDSFDDLAEITSYSILVIKRQESSEPQLSRTNTSRTISALKIVSDIIAVSVDADQGITLKSPLTLTFGVSNLTQLESHVTPACVYLHTSVSGHVTWSRKGCLTESFTDDQIICKCNHLTSFAVLMGPKQLAEYQALTALTITGCSVSILCLIITIVVYLYLWRYVKSERSVLLVNLCVCMLISYLVFLVGIDKTNDQNLCQFIAIFLHYSLLCVFFNFLSQGLALYKYIFNMSGQPRMEILLSVTYMTPLLIVGVTALVNKAEGYGTSNYCWLSVNKGFIWSFLGPVILILLVNSAVLSVIIKTIQSTRAMSDKTHAERAQSAARTIMVLTPLFGLTWTFGLLSLLTDLLPIQYLFVMFNTFQGLFICVIYCVKNKQILEAILNTRRQRIARNMENDNKKALTTSTF